MKPDGRGLLDTWAINLNLLNVYIINYIDINLIGAIVNGRPTRRTHHENRFPQSPDIWRA